MKPALVKLRYPNIPKAVDLHVCFVFSAIAVMIISNEFRYQEQKESK